MQGQDNVIFLFNFFIANYYDGILFFLHFFLLNIFQLIFLFRNWLLGLYILLRLCLRIDPEANLSLSGNLRASFAIESPLWFCNSIIEHDSEFWSKFVARCQYCRLCLRSLSLFFHIFNLYYSLSFVLNS